MPDVDVDFCFERRGEVIEYVRQKYGKESVCQIVTFGTMKSRAAIKDVGRTLGFTPAETDALAKLIPNQPNFSLTVKEAIEQIADVGQAVSHRRALSAAARLRDGARRTVAPHGRARGRRRHRAGSGRRLRADLHAVVARAPASGDDESVIVSQYDMNCLEKAGMLKMDFLGLTTLTVIHDALVVDRAAHRQGARPRRDADIDDPKVYQMLRAGRTTGVFQFESPLATDMLRSMRCDRFDDLVASNALMRPGPLDAGMHTRLSAPQARRGAGDATRCPSSSRSSSRRTASSPIRSR